ncbi:MAG: hypothetical protein ACTHNH_02220 [Mesorhizobium sp.]
MGTEARTKSGTSKDSNIWELSDARDRFDDLLAAAANRGPQIIRGENLHFRLSLERAQSSPKGTALLTKGVPRDDDDVANG